jgi:hypothetical protein
MIGVTLAVTGAGALLAQTATLAEAVQAFVAEWGATRLGVSWGERPAKRAGVGALGGLAAAALSLTVGRVSGVLPPFSLALAPVTVGLGVIDAGLVAVRDEMLLRGFVLRLTVARRLPALTACALASIAWALGSAGEHGAPPVELASQGLAGAWFGALWLRPDGAPLACGAHAAWLLAGAVSGAGPSALTGSYTSAFALAALVAITLAIPVRPETSAGPRGVG